MRNYLNSKWMKELVNEYNGSGIRVYESMFMKSILNNRSNPYCYDIL